MKAIQLAAKQKLTLVDIPHPVLRKDTDVLIKVEAVGVCGSDVHYYNNGCIGDQIITFPFIIGHELAGIVEQVGSKVKRVKPGDRIAVDPAVSCYTCDQCKAGRPHTCRHLSFLGCPGQLAGCLAEYIIMPEQSCYPVPPDMTREIAALCEPLTIGYYAVHRTGDVRNKTIGILGSGPIGMSVMLACLLKGAEKIYMTDKLDYRCDMASKHGAVWTGNPDKVDVVSAILKQEPLQLDYVFECCGKQEAFDQAFSLLKPGGTVAVIGIPEFSRYSFSVDHGRRNEITIQHIRRQNECTLPIVEAVSQNKIFPHFMITHRFTLEESSIAFDLVAGYKDNVMKAMILF
ncbi:MAG: alcohol dehydrogenase catalytic domain-containing protein [Spirochaetales bacterium]|nr:alcohol dehydrogenase catalytic domain-containing protein [Spirochaetales bacterium]